MYSEEINVSGVNFCPVRLSSEQRPAQSNKTNATCTELAVRKMTNTDIQLKYILSSNKFYLYTIV